MKQPVSSQWANPFDIARIPARSAVNFTFRFLFTGLFFRAALREEQGSKARVPGRRLEARLHTKFPASQKTGEMKGSRREHVCRYRRGAGDGERFWRGERGRGSRRVPNQDSEDGPHGGALKPPWRIWEGGCGWVCQIEEQMKRRDTWCIFVFFTHGNMF